MFTRQARACLLLLLLTLTLFSARRSFVHVLVSLGLVLRAAILAVHRPAKVPLIPLGPIRCADKPRLLLNKKAEERCLAAVAVRR